MVAADQSGSVEAQFLTVSTFAQAPAGLSVVSLSTHTCALCRSPATGVAGAEGGAADKGAGPENRPAGLEDEARSTSQDLQIRA